MTPAQAAGVKVLAAGLAACGAKPIGVFAGFANPVPCLVYDDASGKRRGCYVFDDGHTMSAAFGCEPDPDRATALIDWRTAAPIEKGDAA